MRSAKALPDEPVADDALLSVQGLTKSFSTRVDGRRRVIPVVSDVSFEVGHGQSVGLVGESGCGKTTVGRTIMRLYEPDGGTVSIEGTAIDDGNVDLVHRSVSMVFQDPYTSLDPRKTISEILEEPLRVRRIVPRQRRRDLTAQAVEAVGLKTDCLGRYPFSLSGGQRQRVAIARALIGDPKLVICDEAVSALDVSIQAQVLNMLSDLQAKTGVAYLFISHDLAVVRHLCTHVIAMYLGRVVEVAETDELFRRPLHPYVEALLSAIPVPDPDRARPHGRFELAGELPALSDLPAGCVFSTRCPYVAEACRHTRPSLVDCGNGHLCACARWHELHLAGAGAQKGS
jgi:oligopeptide/dipeptide ABC transporter ATP-binding protein